METLPYHRELLVAVLVYHQRTDTSGCHCGWALLGASHPEHVADVYEQALNERCKDPHCQGCSNPGCVGHGLRGQS